MAIEEITGISAVEFWNRYAKRGSIGLVGGTNWIFKMVCDAQALVTPDGKPSLWAHTFIFTGVRTDRSLWIAESALSIDFLRLQIKNGAQENRITNYSEKDMALNCAVLDFSLSDTDTDKIVGKALDMVAAKTMYSVSGLLGTLFAYVFKTARDRNLLNTTNALYCSAFVKEAYLHAGIDLAPNVATTNTSPEHIWLTNVPHKAYLLKRT